MSDGAEARVELVECVENEGYEVDLRVGSVYHMLPDPIGERRGLLRVVDETGDDFMFPKRCFVPVGAGHAEESTMRQAF